jgi:membrane protease YdiL (CAAX protease family)
VQIDEEDLTLQEVESQSVGDRARWGVLHGLGALGLFYVWQILGGATVQALGVPIGQSAAALLLFLPVLYAAVLVSTAVLLGAAQRGVSVRALLGLGEPPVEVLERTERPAPLLSALHLKPPPPMRMEGLLRIGLACAAAYAIFSFGLHAVYQWMGRTQVPVQPVAGLLRGESSLAVRILAVVVVAGLTPFVEEVIFRGALYIPLRNALGVVPAMFIVAVIFALGHEYIWGVPQLLLLSCILVVLMEYSRSLWPAIVAHALNNALMLVLLWLPGQ